jgi:hypothetical protein
MLAIPIIGALALSGVGPAAEPAPFSRAVAQDLCGSHLVAAGSVQSQARVDGGTQQDVILEELFRQSKVAEDATAEPVQLAFEPGDHITILYPTGSAKPTLTDTHVLFLRKIPGRDAFTPVKSTALLKVTGGRAQRTTGEDVASEAAAIQHLRAVAEHCVDME